MEVPLHPVVALLRASEVPAASEAGFEAAPDAAAWTRRTVGGGFFLQRYVYEFVNFTVLVEWPGFPDNDEAEADAPGNRG